MLDPCSSKIHHELLKFVLFQKIKLNPCMIGINFFLVISPSILKFLVEERTWIPLFLDTLYLNVFFNSKISEAPKWRR